MSRTSSCLISVIIPSFNQPDFVACCLESVVSQAGAAFEVIVIDGGSNADTLDKIKAYEARLTHFVSEKDRGQSHAINKGLRLARGQLVTWLNTDDFYLPGALAALTEAYHRNPNASFYMGRGFRTNLDDSARQAFYPERFMYSHEALVWGLNFVLQPATFINRRHLQAVGDEVKEELHFAMDSDLWLRLAGQCPPEWIEHDMACSREYPTTKTAGGGWKRVGEIQRVSQQFSGATLTPGVLAEICRQLLECSEQPEVARRFTPQFRQAIINLWGEAGHGLRQVAYRDDGVPVKPAHLP